MTIRITRTMAEKAASKMADKAYNEKIDEITKDIDKGVEKIVKKYIPAPVIACVNEYPSYFYASNNASIITYDDNGYRESYIYGKLTFSLPNSTGTINVEKDDYYPLRELYDKRSAVCEDCDKFRTKVQEALISLGTLKRVQENLPEAVKYIELPSSAIPLAPVYTELNNLIGAIK